MTLGGTFVVGENHPALAGHFPNNPVVPGTVVLDESLAVLREQGVASVIRIERAKFMATLPLDVPCQVRASSRKNGGLAVECIANSRLVLSAIFQCDRPGDKR